ncbi:MAG TPA: hypothetical protein VL098_10725 [Flavipsychrobacter sp.]|nr:hypothetical protein [Flavipsychrobacter sp.]
MDVHLIKYKTALSKDELSFLKQKEMKERKQLYKVVRVLMIMCFICPFAGAWIKALKGDELAFSYLYYFLGVTFLMFFSGIGVFMSYRAHLYKVRQDIRHATKTVETVQITRKQYMPSNNTYYFYLSSPVKLSIEVEEEYYRSLEKGDQVNIEYTPYSKQYLGYF